MRWIFLFLLFLLPSWVYAADGDSLELPYAEFVEVDDTTAKFFQEAGCKKDTPACGFPGNDVLYGSFTGANRTEAIVLSGISMDCPCISIGELFSFTNGEWEQLGPFDNRYSFKIGNECYKILASSGNELLLCVDNYANSYEDFYVDPEFFPFYTLRLIDLSKTPAVTSIFSTEKVGGNSLFCRDLQTNEAFKLLDDIHLTFEDFNSDSQADVSVNLRETEINLSQCATTTEEGGVMNLGGKPAARHELYWLFDGETFTPTPETKAFLDNLLNQ